MIIPAVVDKEEETSNWLSSVLAVVGICYYVMHYVYNLYSPDVFGGDNVRTSTEESKPLQYNIKNEESIFVTLGCFRLGVTVNQLCHHVARWQCRL